MEYPSYPVPGPAMPTIPMKARQRSNRGAGSTVHVMPTPLISSINNGGAGHDVSQQTRDWHGRWTDMFARQTVTRGPYKLTPIRTSRRPDQGNKARVNRRPGRVSSFVWAMRHPIMAWSRSRIKKLKRKSKGALYK